MVAAAHSVHMTNRAACLLAYHLSNSASCGFVGTRSLYLQGELVRIQVYLCL